MYLINFDDSKDIARIYEIHYNSHYQGAVKVFNRTVQNFFTSAKDYRKKNIF